MRVRLIAVAFGLLMAVAPAPAPATALEFVTASDSSFSRPHDVTLDPAGRYLYVADLGIGHQQPAGLVEGDVMRSGELVLADDPERLQGLCVQHLYDGLYR